uniref:hypothetical protein n=1 Tax=Aliarcobacter sp. TaxID=2321116 RepID=UPI004047BB4D
MNIELLKEVKTPEETASIVYEILKAKGIEVVLTGGSCMEIYTHSNYSSYDLDFIANPSIKSEQVKNAMIEAGFEKTKDRYFKHPDNDYYVEFPTGPVSLGNEEPKEHNELKTHVGTLKLLTPTNCVKDRLCAYLYHNGEECFSQAIAVAHRNKIDEKDLLNWAVKECSKMEDTVNELFKDLEYLNKTVNNQLIKSYLKTKEEKHKVDISIEADFLLLTDDLIDDYVIHELLEIELGDDASYYEKMEHLYKKL